MGHALKSDHLIRIYNDVSDYGALLARRFCELYDEHISKKVGFPVGLKFEMLVVPEIYNAAPDRILAKIPAKSVSAIYAMSEAGEHKGLKRKIVNWRAPPWDGPCYGKDPKKWLDKPVAKWDRNELSLLLDTFVDPDIERKVFHRFDKDDFYEAFKNSIDRKKFDKKVAAIRRQGA